MSRKRTSTISAMMSPSTESEICLLYSTKAEVFLQSRVASNTALLWIEYLCLGGVCLT